MTESQPATTYPTSQQYARWKDRAKDFGMSVSEFIQYMVEAGLKKFDARVEADESRQELRQQRNDLKAELEHARDRIDTLETHFMEPSVRPFAISFRKTPVPPMKTSPNMSSKAPQIE
mgnify:CR=1 FL=1